MTAITISNGYTENKFADVEKNIDKAKTDTLSASNNYTDQKTSNAQTAAVKSSNDYTDQKVSDAKTAAVKSSNDYTDQKVSDAKTAAVKSSNDYTDQKVVDVKTEAVATSNTYTDNKVSNIHSAIDDSRKQAVSSGQQYTNARFTELETSMNGRFNSVEQQMNKNADRANAGIASVAAMANIPYTDNTRFSMGLGAGNYRNGNAVAFGGQLRMENNVNLRTSVSWNSEDSAVYGAGVAFGF
ncbi:YadA-like family protein [Morganella morganii]|uniref:YadA-like family protein n=1 Tax=Gammaproteobacteria TaxID=1236 RepID=UPI00164942D2|nr:YadA-like family protein [Morganella morganii]MBC3997325.1 YadA-like family protein [Morganella morganii]MBT0386179.1 YadA-like family protein [Morganella morganii subsp. morganii]